MQKTHRNLLIGFVVVILGCLAAIPIFFKQIVHYEEKHFAKKIAHTVVMDGVDKAKSEMNKHPYLAAKATNYIDTHKDDKDKAIQALDKHPEERHEVIEYAKNSQEGSKIASFLQRHKELKQDMNEEATQDAPKTTNFIKNEVKKDDTYSASN